MRLTGSNLRLTHIVFPDSLHCKRAQRPLRLLLQVLPADTQPGLLLRRLLRAVHQQQNPLRPPVAPLPRFLEQETREQHPLPEVRRHEGRPEGNHQTSGGLHGEKGERGASRNAFGVPELQQHEEEPGGEHGACTEEEELHEDSRRRSVYKEGGGWGLEELYEFRNGGEI